MCQEEKRIIEKFKAHDFFNFIDQNLINRKTQECINLGNTDNKCSEHYGNMNYYPIDPFLSIWEKSFRQTIYFRELNYVNQKYWNSNIPVGKVINQERALKFNIHDGIYRSFPLDKEWEYLCIWGTEKKNFDFNNQFSLSTFDGRWFFNLEKELISLVQERFLSQIKKNTIQLKFF